MYINEIEAESKVHLEVTTKGNKLEFDTIAKGGSTSERSVKCDPVLVEGKKIGFSNVKVKAYVTNVTDGREYTYNIDRSLNRKDGFLYLFSNMNVAPVNHRESFRVPCGYRVQLQIGEVKRNIEGVVLDISYSGAAYLIKRSSRTVSVGSMVSATIYDEDETAYKIKGSIVRTVEDYDAENVLLGVQFMEQVPSIVSLVARLNVRAARVRIGKT